MDAVAASASEQQPARDQKRHNGIPVLAASMVLVLSALGWQLMGAGVVVHFLVLLSGIAIGALFRKSAVDRRDSAADRAAATAAAAAGARTTAGAIAGDGTPASSNDGGLATLASGQESLIPSLLSNTATTGGVSSAGGATAASSPLNWVGETMEGSINWLCGNNNNNNNGRKSSAEQSNGRRATAVRGNRRRSRSTGGGGAASPTSPSADGTGMARSAATSPARGAAGPRRAAEADALPALGAGLVPQEQQGLAPAAPARSRLWSRTFGGGAGGGTQQQQQQQQPTAEGFADAYDGDDSVEDDDDGGTDGDESLRLRGVAAGGVGDWLVGAGLGDTRRVLHFKYVGEVQQHRNCVRCLFFWMACSPVLVEGRGGGDSEAHTYTYTTQPAFCRDVQSIRPRYAQSSQKWRTLCLYSGPARME